MAFLELRWNYSPLKEKAVQLPDGLFVFFCREAIASLHPAPEVSPMQDRAAPDARRSARKSASRLPIFDRYATNRSGVRHLDDVFCA
jgi:hypothetical protein